MTAETLAALTSPGTKITLADGRQALLGPAAAEIVGLIAGFHKASTASDRKNIESELRPAIEQEVTKTLMSKLKKGDGFRSLDMVPGSGAKSPTGGGQLLSEADFARLSPAEQEAYLQG
jgi:hypothetical protein